MKNPLVLFGSLSHDVRYFLYSYFFLTLSYNGIQTVLLNLYLLKLGYGIEGVAMTTGAILLSFSLCSIPVGVLVRRFSPRRLIMTGGWLILSSFILLMTNELVPRLLSPFVLVGGSCGIGAGGALFVVTAPPLFMRCTAQQRPSVFSFRFLVSMTSASIGGFIGGFLPGLFIRVLGPGAADLVIYRSSIACCVFGYCVAIYFGSRMSRRPKVHGASEPCGSEAARASGTAGESASIVKPPLALFGVVFACGFLTTMGSNVFQSVFNVFLDQTFGVSVGVIGLAYGFSRIAQIPGLLVAPTLIRRFGPFRMRLVSPVASVVLILSEAVSNNLAISIVAFLAIGFASSTGSGAAELFGQSVVDARYRGMMAGITSAAFGLGGSIMMVGGAYIITVSGFPALFASASGLIFGSFAVFVSYFRRRVTQLLPEYHGPYRVTATRRLTRSASYSDDASAECKDPTQGHLG